MFCFLTGHGDQQFRQSFFVVVVLAVHIESQVHATTSLITVQLQNTQSHPVLLGRIYIVYRWLRDIASKPTPLTQRSSYLISGVG